MPRFGILFVALAFGTTLLLCGCVRVEEVRLPADGPGKGTPVIYSGRSDLVSANEPHPPALGAQVGYSDLKGLRPLLRQSCPNWNGEGLTGLWVRSFETLIFQVRDCRVVAVQHVYVGDRMIDAVQGDFCTPKSDFDIVPIAGAVPTTVFLDRRQVEHYTA